MLRRSFHALLIGLPLMAAAPALAQEKPKVVTTFTIIADIAANVAGDAATVESITKPGAEIHNYQPTPRDILKAQNAQLVLRNGLNLELWFEKFLANLGDVPNVTVSDGITPMSIVEGPYEGKPNPHAWMSPDNALVYVENIRKALGAEMKAKIGALPEEKRWLVTSEGAFSYLARDFGLNELFLWPINADQQGTPKQVKAVIDAVREHNIHVVFSDSTVSAKPAEQVAAETGAAYGGVLYVDSLSEASGPVPTYLDLLRVTSETIVKGLSQ